MCPAPDQLAPAKILILQSAEDQAWVVELSRLLTSILQLDDDQVRSKSLGSLRLPLTPEHHRQLEQEARGVPVVVVVLSGSTLAAPLEMLEIGATWAAGAPAIDRLFIPVRIPGSEPPCTPDVGKFEKAGSAATPIDGAALEDLVGQIAGSLGIVPANLGAHRGRLIQLAAPRSRGARRKQQGERNTTRWLIGITAGISIAAVAMVLLRSHPPQIAPERFGFEEQTSVWSLAPPNGAQGFVQAARSSTHAHLGGHSLRLDTALAAADANRRSGEVLFELPKIIDVNSADLTGHTISLWVYAPSGAVGDAAKPNGLQLVVKDRNWKSQYGAWHNVIEREWTKLTLSVGAANGPAHIDSGFQPNAVVAIGIKMSMGDGAKTDYSGALYVDTVGW